MMDLRSISNTSTIKSSKKLMKKEPSPEKILHPHPGLPKGNSMNAHAAAVKNSVSNAPVKRNTAKISLQVKFKGL
jgi:hypothetical protein